MAGFTLVHHSRHGAFIAGSNVIHYSRHIFFVADSTVVYYFRQVVFVAGFTVTYYSRQVFIVVGFTVNNSKCVSSRASSKYQLKGLHVGERMFQKANNISSASNINYNSTQ